MRLIVLIGASFSLAACQTTRGGDCPPLVTYSVQQQRQAAAELRKMSKSQIAKMIVDYGKMRDACRVR